MAHAFWSRVASRLAAGESVFVALVAHSTRHSPGTSGAKFGVTAGGESFGTIGGGIMELEIVARAAKALAGPPFPPQFQTLVHRQEGKGDKSGLICAGHQTNVYVVLRPEQDTQRVKEIIARLAEDRAGLVELIELNPDGLRLLDQTPGPDEAPVALSKDDDGRWRYTEQLLNWKRIAIIGGGHCGLALSRTMAQLGYVVTVFDTRDVPTFTENMHARYRHRVSDFVEAGALITHPALTHVVVMTTDLAGDVRGLLGVLEDDYPYIGVMGAPAKLVRIKSELREGGFSREQIDRVWAPVGLTMTSNTPEEIAVSVAAQILQMREKLFAQAVPQAT
ncbi:MAG: XdhC family protein [Bradymonadaceae bacterium]|nr:XdhC family protein [Lujinxingiaceae bacterium]